MKQVGGRWKERGALEHFGKRDVLMQDERRGCQSGARGEAGLRTGRDVWLRDSLKIFWSLQAWEMLLLAPWVCLCPGNTPLGRCNGNILILAQGWVPPPGFDQCCLRGPKRWSWEGLGQGKLCHGRKHCKDLPRPSRDGKADLCQDPTGDLAEFVASQESRAKLME